MKKFFCMLACTLMLFSFMPKNAEATTLYNDIDIVDIGIFNGETWLTNEIQNKLSPKTFGSITFGDLKSITEIKIPGGGISGKLPNAIEYLKGLTEIDLSNNDLTGVLPTGLGNLEALVKLDLSNNKFSENIPSELNGLKDLEHFNLSNNNLTGTLPQTLGNINKLRYLNLSNNKLTGNIPNSFGSLTYISSLNLSNNQLTGIIPDELKGLSNLSELNLSNNQLAGTLPQVLSNVESIDVSNNYLADGIEGQKSISATVSEVPLNLGNSFDILDYVKSSTGETLSPYINWDVYVDSPSVLTVNKTILTAVSPGNTNVRLEMAGIAVSGNENASITVLVKSKYSVPVKWVGIKEDSSGDELHTTFRNGEFGEVETVNENEFTPPTGWVSKGNTTQTINFGDTKEIVFNYYEDLNNNNIADIDEKTNDVFKITETYEDELGNKLSGQSDTTETITGLNKSYSKLAPRLDGYEYTGYKYNNGEFVVGNPYIENVISDATIVLIYRNSTNNPNNLTGTGKYIITEKYNDIYGNIIPGYANTSTILDASNNTYSKNAPNINGYIYEGYMFDGAALTKGDPSINDINENHEISFVYSEAKTGNNLTGQNNLRSGMLGAGLQGVEGADFTITEKYKDLYGVDIPGYGDTFTGISNASPIYSKIPPTINGYAYQGYMIGDSLMEFGDPYIDNVTTDQTVTMMYLQNEITNEDSIGEPFNGLGNITEENGSLLGNQSTQENSLTQSYELTNEYINSLQGPERKQNFKMNRLTLTGGDVVIGSGTPNSNFALVFPNNTILYTSTDSEGIWTVEIPNGTTINLNENDIIKLIRLGSGTEEDVYEAELKVVLASQNILPETGGNINFILQSISIVLILIGLKFSKIKFNFNK